MPHQVHDALLHAMSGTNRSSESGIALTLIGCRLGHTRDEPSLRLGATYDDDFSGQGYNVAPTRNKRVVESG